MKKKVERFSKTTPTRQKLKDLIREAKQKKMKTPFSEKQLAEFKKILVRLKQGLQGNLSRMEDETLSQSRREASGDLSNLPNHLADLGTDSYEQDLTLGLIESEGEVIHEIDAAIDRIEEQTYGICERCNQSISGKRLKIIPYARLCIKCKAKEESAK